MKKKQSEEGQPIGIVSAFFDIGRGEIGEGHPDYLRRTNDTYFEYFSNLATLENKMVIFTSEEYRNDILKIRKGKPTKIIIVDLKKKFRRQIEAIGKIQQSEEFKSRVNKDMLVNIEYWSPEYVLINNLKTYFVNYAIRKNLFSEELVSWVDFGYVRDKETLNNIDCWKYPFDKMKIHFFTIRRKHPLNTMEDVHSAIFNNAVYIIGGAVVGSHEKWKEFYRLLKNNQNELLKQNIIDDDQGLYMMSIFKKPELFKLNYLGKDRWFWLFRKYDETSKVSFWDKIKDMII
jgi:protein htrL